MNITLAASVEITVTAFVRRGDFAVLERLQLTGRRE